MEQGGIARPVQFRLHLGAGQGSEAIADRLLRNSTSYLPSPDKVNSALVSPASADNLVLGLKVVRVGLAPASPDSWLHLLTAIQDESSKDLGASPSPDGVQIAGANFNSVVT